MNYAIVMDKLGEIFKGFLGKKEPAQSVPQRDIKAEIAKEQAHLDSLNAYSSVDKSALPQDNIEKAKSETRLNELRTQLGPSGAEIQPSVYGLNKIMEANRVNTSSPEPTSPNTAEPTPLHPETGVQAPPAQPAEEKAA